MSYLLPREHLKFPLEKPKRERKPSKPLRAKAKQPRRRDERDGMSEAYLAAIRQLPCCVCAAPGPSDPHHLKAGTGERGVSLRSTDKFAVPLCRTCHDEVEGIGSSNEEAWFAARNVKALLLAAQLWTTWLVSQSVSDLRRIVAAHQLDQEETRP